MMIPQVNINSLIHSKPAAKAESAVRKALVKFTSQDSVVFQKKIPVTRESLSHKLEKYGLDAGTVRKVVNDHDTDPSLLEKTFENINNAFSRDGFVPSDWFDALVYTGDSKAFTRDNLEKLRKIDFSGLKRDAAPTEKLLALNSAQSPDSIEFALKLLNPVKKEISPLDLASLHLDAIKFLRATAEGRAPINLNQFIELAKAKRSLTYPYDFFVSSKGDIANMAYDYDIINRALFGAQTGAQKEAAARLFNETGIKVRMDNNLDPENIEYLREFINITRASGDELPRNIYITNLLSEKTNGAYAHSDAFFTRPVVDASGKINENRLSTMAHENAHFLDYKINKNNGYAANSRSVAETEMESDLMELFVSGYARKNREEFIAEIKKLAFEGKILKYKNKYGQSVYRRYFAEEITDEIADDMKPHFAYLLRKYQKFNGPLIRDSILPVVPKNIASGAGKNYVEVTQRDINTAMPPDFY